MKKSELLAMIDHTLLKPEATWEQVKVICDEARANHTASICINPSFVKQAAEYLEGSIPVCTVIGFPLGATSTAAKVAELRQALQDGAEEFDMVIHIGALKAGDLDFVAEEIKTLKAEIPNHILKVIVETALLTEEEKVTICNIVATSGADYIKTSTGFSTGGATFEDVKLFSDTVKGRCKIKAAGGIGSVADMIEFAQLGASRLGTSSGIRYLESVTEDLEPLQ